MGGVEFFNDSKATDVHAVLRDIGDRVLLSPGASSYDMFDSYEERGNYFKEIVKRFR